MNADNLVPGGFPCDQQAAISLPPREDVVHTDRWRVAHALNSALPVWLVLLPTRHVASFTELTPEAADELGGLVRRLGGALEVVTGCVKTYLMQFSEADGFSHLHLHLAPRLPNDPEDARGPHVFAYLLTIRRSGSPRRNTTLSRSPSMQRLRRVSVNALI
jgi:diadenosine tetraphosphate (Ap4A) HIT family hydrolase